jgi:hypothetical protein
LNIRIGALRGKIEGTFQGIISSLTEHRARTIEGARVISDSLEDLFRIFGYPSEVQKSRDRFFHEGKDAITELESLRQRRFSQSVDGSVGSTIAQLLEVYMSSLEAESLREAEKCVIEVFDRGIQLSEKELTKRVFKAESIDSAATTVMRETQEFINAKTSVALADAKFSFEILRLNHAKMDLSAGRVVRWISIGCKVTNMLGGIAATLGSLALANAWNPFGWAAGVASGVAAVGALVGLVFGFAGKKTASAAERKRLEARASGLSDLRESVRQTYAEIKSTVRKTLQESAQETLASLCKPLLLQAYTLIREKQVCDELIRAAETMSTNAKGRSPNSHSSASETDSHPAQGQEAALLLGEDWLGTPSDIEIKKAQDIWNAARPQFEALHANQERLLARFVHNVSEYDVQNWISHVHRFLEKDRFEPKLLADVCRIRNTSIPQISLMGDYNAGKTSFLRRLFFENRLQIPESLRVAGVPTTRSAESYDWGHLRFVDTPGFQSRNRRDTAVALQAAADSIGIFVFFLPNLLLGDDSALRKLLEGDPEAGVTSKRDRIVFVINRIDELGCDPLVSPKGFIALLHRKRIELSQALKSRLGVSVNPDEIICLSSDPFQSLFSGKTQELESDSRCWDGFAELVPALEKVSQKLEAKGNLIGHVDGILARLQRARARLSEVAHQKERELQDIEIGSFGRSLRSLENLRNAMSSELRTKIQLRLAELATNILKASNRQELMNRWQAIEDLSSDAELVSILNAWSIDTENQLEQWINQTGDELNRIFETQKWRNSTFRIHTQMECPAAEHGGRESLRTTIKVLKTTAGAATRETVLVVGKAIKFKFRPWQAVKIARFGAKATVVLAVVGNVLDVLTEIQEQRESREVERKRLKLRTELEILGESFVSKILDGDEEQPGLNPQLNEIQEKLKAERAQSETRCQKLRGQSFAISRKLKMYDELIRQGSRLLESRAEDFIDEKERRVG